MVNNIRGECLRPASEQWEKPTPLEIREVLRLIAARKGITKFTGGQTAKYLGLGEFGARTIRRWTGGESDIPYAAWALLCHLGGLGMIWVETES